MLIDMEASELFSLGNQKVSESIESESLVVVAVPRTPKSSQLHYFDIVEEIVLYPNPATNYVRLDFNSGDLISHAGILDMRGRLVLARVLTSNTGDHLIEIDMIENGTNTLEIFREGYSVFSQNFVKQLD